MKNVDGVFAIVMPTESNNWMMKYNGFTLSVFIDNKNTVDVRGREMLAYTRMDVCVIDANGIDVTEAFFGHATIGGGVWAVSSFTAFLETLESFKERVDANEMLRKMWQEPVCGVLGVDEKHAVDHIADTGCIPMHTKCPFREKCEIAQGGQCVHKGVNHQCAFSCAAARGFLITEK